MNWSWGHRSERRRTSCSNSEKTRNRLDSQSGRTDSWRKRRPTRSLETETDFESGMEARRELQERFRVYFPALPRSMAVTGGFCSAAGRATKAHGLPQQLNNPPPSLGSSCFCFCWEVWRGAAPSNSGRAVARLGRPTDAPFWFSSDPQKSQG
jgi:hypothetical protein